MTSAPADGAPVASGAGLHRLGALLWQLLVTLLVLLAVYVSAGRLLTSYVGELRPQIVELLNRRLPFTVAAEQLAGHWVAFSPEFSFSTLSLAPDGGEETPVRVDRGRLRLDIPGSLRAGSLQLSRLEVSGLTLRARLRDDGSLALEGFESAGGAALADWLRAFLPRVERVSLRENAVMLRGDERDELLQLDLSLQRTGNDRRLQARLATDGLQLALRADGVGNPLRPLSWAGDLYLDLEADELGRLHSLWESLDWPFSLAGSARAQFWLRRGDDQSRATLRLNGEAVRLDEAGGAWSLPLDALSFEAALAQQRSQWTLTSEAFHAERDGRSLDLARVQFDWWGQALRIRAEELGLESLPTLLAAAPGLPMPLRDVLPELAPTGRLRAVELRLDDLARPAATWGLRATLEDIAVESWRRAPALDGVSGYLDIGPGGGALQLDAAPFRMFFPSVYEEPLDYDSAIGEIELAWDPHGLSLQSGLLRLVGNGGKGLGRFALDVPFSPRDTGIEMGLLVGLRDASVGDRDRYLPKRLPKPLLGWLGSSVEAGQVRRADFLWRGSLRPRNYPHITVQLFLDVADARLRYDPRWPPLHSLDARVWVDDGLTWGLADRAGVYRAALSDLAVRVERAAPGALLWMTAAVQGDAADAQRLLVESPLAALTGTDVTRWRFAGPIAGQLDLQLPLGDADSRQRVDLDLHLDRVDLDVSSLALPLRDVEGVLSYHTDSGFAGSGGAGTLWGHPVTAEVTVTTPGVTELALGGRLDGEALADWLQQPLLRVALGESGLSGTLRLAGAGQSMLTLESDLIGMSLEAPHPFAKPASQPLALKTDLALTADPRLAITLGERLALSLDFRDGALAAGSAILGGGEAPACDVDFCLSGRVSAFDVLEWRDFARRYLPPAAAPGAVSSYRVDGLLVADLSAGERHFGTSRIDVLGQAGRWQGALESGWLQGALTRDEERLQLLVERLELDGLRGGEPPKLEELAAQLPSMRVDVLELRREGRSLGALGFDLDVGNDGGLYFGAIEGELFGIDLAPSQPGLMAWVPGPDGEETALELDAAFGDLGKVLPDAGFAPTLQSRRGTASVRLRWPGNPLDYAVRSASGVMQFEMRDGRVLESGPGALSLVRVLNFSAILQSLSLTSMFETGIPFDTALSDLRLDAGAVDISRLELDGAASAFSFRGRSDLASGALDGELVVTLPVANNLPWVAALAGGPAMAAGVFVVSKVFEKQVNRMSSAVYRVSGTINDPDLRFTRLFDDRPDATTPQPGTLSPPEVP